MEAGRYTSLRLLFGLGPGPETAVRTHGIRRSDAAFFTTLGNKREADSYRKIAAAIGAAPGDILFLSDIKEELDAARVAGMQVRWLVRDGAVDPQADHRQVANFDTISLP